LFSSEIEPPRNGAPNSLLGVSFHALKTVISVLNKKPIPKPMEMILPPLVAESSV